MAKRDDPTAAREHDLLKEKWRRQQVTIAMLQNELARLRGQLDHGPMCACGHSEHPHAFGDSKRACGICDCEVFTPAVPESGLQRVRRFATEMLAEEQDERDKGDPHALERGSVYENVIEWIDNASGTPDSLAAAKDQHCVALNAYARALLSGQLTTMAWQEVWSTLDGVIAAAKRTP